MNSRHFGPEPCDELPVLTANARQLIRGLDDNKSLDDLFSTVVEMAGDLEEQGIACRNLVKMFEDESAEAHKNLRILFHTFNRDMLRSLVLGTLAYDLWQRDSGNWRNTYAHPSIDSAGAYLITISIKGREGKFLSYREIKTLASHLMAYELGCRAYIVLREEDRWGHSQLDQGQQDNLRDALLIDNEITPEDRRWDEETDEFWEPNCIGSAGGTSGGLKGLEAIATLRRQLLQRQVEDEETYQCASPAYVGCSQTLLVRMPTHVPSGMKVKSSSTLLRLLIACIRRMGLVESVHAITMMTVWEPWQVPLAEALVTVLAQSLVTSSGLNVVQPGTSSQQGAVNRRMFEETKEHVWVERPWFVENLERSLENFQGRDIYRQVLDEAITAEDVRSQVEKTETRADANEELYGELSRALEEREPEIGKAGERLRSADSFYKLSKGMFPGIPDSDDEAEGG